MNHKNIITIVSGLPRSGTSMMMKMLEAGGMETVQDGIRKSDEDNPGGYYEFETVKQIKENASWLDMAAGKVVKILFNFLYDLPLDKHYQIIFMERDIDEVLASQNKMLERRGEVNKINDQEMAALFRVELPKIKDWLAKQGNFEVRYIHYTNVLNNSDGTAHLMNQFLEYPLNTKEMVKIIDRSLYRNRKSLSSRA